MSGRAEKRRIPAIEGIVSLGFNILFGSKERISIMITDKSEGFPVPSFH